MNTKAKIKVIKKGTKNSSVELPKDAAKKTTQQAAREIVSTVTNWVSEFQQRRREETKQAIEKLLPLPTQTNGV